MARYFEFESDFVKNMRCIPMQVRYRLDAVGLKLGLKEWFRLTEEERQALADTPGETPDELNRFREQLAQLIQSRSGAPVRELPVAAHPAWLDQTAVPDEVQCKAAESSVTIAQEQWQALDPLQRFALIKLCRPSHENMNFLPALKEFGLA